MIMDFIECEKAILELIRKYYTDGNVQPADAKTLDDKGFIVERHADALWEAAKSNSEEAMKYGNFIVLFRQAGKPTLRRIKEGSPCKGHKILSKTIKKKDGKWTYKFDKEDLDALKSSDGSFWGDLDLGKLNLLEELQGYVGYGETKEDGEIHLQGVYVFDEAKGFAQRGIGDVIKEIIENNRLDGKSFKDESFFTGDYDMEDLFIYKNGGYKHVLAFLEGLDIEALNKIILDAMEADNDRRLEQFQVNKERLTECEYSLIRHGAQSSYVSYLWSDEGVKELENIYNEYVAETGNKAKNFLAHLEESIVKIGTPLCAIDATGSYILENVEDVVAYYRDRGLLDQIPVYYFINDLKKRIKEEKKFLLDIEEYISKRLVLFFEL